MSLGGRASAEQAYRRSSACPSTAAYGARSIYLDMQFELGPEIELLKSYRRLYPYDEVAANFLGWLYTFALEDPVSAEPHLRAAYQINPASSISRCSQFYFHILGKGDEIARVAEDYTARTGQEPAAAIVATHALRRDWRAMLQAIERYDREETLSRFQVANLRAWMHLKSGSVRKRRNRRRSPGARRSRSKGPDRIQGVKITWLKMRQGRPVVLSPEDFARAARTVCWPFDGGRSLRWKQAVRNLWRASSRNFRRWNVGLKACSSARSCSSRAVAWRSFVATLKTARRLIEPLAENTEVPHRFHALGRLYEAQGMWPEAAAQYEAVVKPEPHGARLACPVESGSVSSRTGLRTTRRSARALVIVRALRRGLERRRPGHPRAGDCSPKAGSTQQTLTARYV